MKDAIHYLRRFLSRYKIFVSFLLSIIVFIVLISYFPTRATRMSGILIFSEDMIGKPLTVFIVALIWFGLFYLMLEYDDSGEFNNKKKQYEDAKSLIYSEAAKELQDREKIRMDIWGKALVAANGNEELAKAEYIRIRIKEVDNQTIQ